MKPLYWDDLKVSVLRGTTGANNPTLTTFVSGIQSYAFDATTMNQIFFDVQFPHSMVLGTQIDPHLHWAPSSTNTGVCRWGLEYSWQNINGGAFPTSTTVYAPQAGAGVALGHQIVSFGLLSTAGKTASSVMMCRLFRDAADGTDTFTGNGFAISIDFHYQSRSLGSVGEYG